MNTEWHKILVALGWEICKTPSWANYEPAFIPEYIYKYNSGTSEGMWADNFRDTYYLNYYATGQFHIYRHRVGGFSGIDVNFPVFYGRSEFGSFTDKENLRQRHNELSQIMRMVVIN